MANIPAFYAPTPPSPQRPPGLFDVAMGPMPFPVAQVQSGGLLYIPDDCVDDAFLYSIQCPAVSGSKTFSAMDAPVSGAPFAVVVTVTCSPVSFSLEEQTQRVLTRMNLREQIMVESRLWQGQQAGGLTLGGITGQFRGATSLGTAACVTEATEMLEQALADNGVTGGMLHARWGMSAHMSNSKLLLKPPFTGNTPPARSYTKLGTPVVFGMGYNGTGPNGEAVDTDTEYMYASGRVLIWQGETIVPPTDETFNRSTNQALVLAERAYVTVVECGVWTVKVTRNCSTAS